MPFFSYLAVKIAKSLKAREILSRENRQIKYPRI